MHARRPHQPCRVALALLALLVVGCGSDEPRSAATAAAVRADVTRALTTADPSICEMRRYATKRFVDQDSFAIAELVEVTASTCRADVEAFAANAVKLSRVEVDGDRATARLKADGGAYGYGVLDLALVRDGVWKLDRITAVDIDRARFDELQARFAGIGADAAPSAVTACVERRIARLSDAQIERAVVRGDVTFLSDPLLVCIVRPELRKELSLELTSCVVQQLQRDGAKLARSLVREDADAIGELIGGASEVCAGALSGSAA